MSTINRRLLIAIAAATVAGTMLAGCTGQDQPTPQETATQGAQPQPDHPTDHGTVAPIPEAPANSQSDALAAARSTMTAFSQTHLSADAWMSGMYPLLSPTGAEAYVGTDPSRIPVHQVTGTGTILDGSTDVSLIVSVPTDAGDYNVTLTRASASAPWLAERIRPANA